MAGTVAYDIAAKRYAEAVYGIARDAGSEDAWRDDLASVAQLAGDADAARYFASNRVSDAEKERLVEMALRDTSLLARNLARLLLQRRRLTLAPQIATEFDRLVDAARGIEHAWVTTAVALGEGDQRAVAERLRQLTGASEVIIETRVDPALIGGMIARIGDTLIDGSTRTKLVQLKRSLAEGGPR